MDALDRLGWATELNFSVHGLPLGIRSSESQILLELIKRLPPGWKPSSRSSVKLLYSVVIGTRAQQSGIRRFHLLYADAARIARTLDLEQLLELFERDIQMRVAELAPRRTFVHAGVVGWRGRAIVIPGPSHSGKSTLVAELMRAGGTYFSDEYAVFDRCGRVLPFARPLSLRGADGATAQRRTAEELGGSSSTDPLPLGLVVVTRYRPHSQWRPRNASPAEGALALLRNTVSVRRQPQAVLKTLTRAVSGVRVLFGARGEASKIVHSLLATELQ
jgi:hypothetical protein